MRFGEPHPFPETGSPTTLSASGQQSYKGRSCRIYARSLNIICPDDVISYKFYKDSQFGTYRDVDIPQQSQFHYSLVL